ncbi:hypothetical protein ACFYP0_05590 [Micromonospora arida]|uniref:hypothetical protein n=1 Tax=Micromonospora arida TaxID=2203715 RepID=UPI0036830BF1
MIANELGEGPRLPTDDPLDMVVGEVAPPGTVGDPVLGEDLGRPLVEVGLEQAVGTAGLRPAYARPGRPPGRVDRAARGVASLPATGDDTEG